MGKNQDWRSIKGGVFGPSQHDGPQHFPQALQCMLWVGHLLHPSDVLLKGCLRIEGVVLEETEIRKELDDMVLDWRATQSPPVFGLHTFQADTCIRDTVSWPTDGKTKTCTQPICISPSSSARMLVDGCQSSFNLQAVFPCRHAETGHKQVLTDSCKA